MASTERKKRGGRSDDGSGAARGLRRMAGIMTKRPDDEVPQGPLTHEQRMERRKIRFKLFSFGNGLDIPLLTFILVLLAVGLVMLFSASYAWGYYHDGDSYYYIKRQLGYAAFGLFVLVVASLFDYHRFHKINYWLFAGSLFLLGLVLFCKAFHINSLSPPQDDAYRWLDLRIISFQPSEVAKFAVITMCAHHISRHAEMMGTLRKGVFPFFVILGLPALLTFPEPHLSATLIIVMIGAVLMIVGGTKIRYIAVIGIAGGVVLWFYVQNKGGYQAGRISGWLDPFNPETVLGDTYQIAQSLYAIGSGGLLGVGLGQSRQKYLYLPEPQNDFIFAIVCEELGFVGALVVIILFALLIWRGMYVSLHARDRFGMLMGLGITFQVGMQAVLNICVVTNTVPNTGISLPFFSFGGSALVMLLGEMGVLLNISRSSSVEKT